MDATMPVREHGGRVLDWRPRFDERSLAYRIGAGVTELPTTGRIWKHGPVLDQGREGACVGFGCAGDAAAEPVPVPGITDQYALTLYRRAQRLDQWDGEAYSGTSVLAGCLAGRERGLWTGFRWATSAEELAAGIVRTASKGGGPAIVGVEWRAGSYETDLLGVLHPSGSVVGGHCLLVLGFVPAGAAQDSTLGQQLTDRDLWDGYLSVGGPVFVILNSWGEVFGKQGLALIPVDVMRAWFRTGGEFAIPQGRTLPPAPTAAAAPDAQPATAGPDRTLHLAAGELEDGDRIVDGLPAELGQETATVQGRQLVAGRGDLVRVRVLTGGFTLRASAPVTVRRVVA